MIGVGQRWALVLGLAAVAVLGLAAAIVALDRYRAGKAAILRDPPRRMFVADNVRLQREGVRPDLLIIGDSRVAEWAPHRALLPGHVVFRGIPGETSPQTEARFATDALALRPRVLIIATGYNDVIAATGVAEAERQAILTAIAPRLLRLARRAQGEGICVRVATIPPPGQLGLAWRIAWGSRVPEHFAAVNAQIAALLPADMLLDFAEWLETRDGRIARRFQRDASHWTAEAYLNLSARLVSLPGPGEACAPDGP